MISPEPNSVYRKAECPYGKKAVRLLNKENIEFEDHLLSSANEEEELKKDLDVETTPQVFLNGDRIGGYDSLSKKFNEEIDSGEEVSYIPVIAIFSVTLILGLISGLGIMGFMGFSLIFLATLKLMDIKSFVISFRKYDLLAANMKPYAVIYPFAELAVGLGFLTLLLPTLVGTISLCMGIIGGVSIYQAVYVKKKDLSCACVGGNSNVPLGAVSISENIMMCLMGASLVLGF